MNDTDRKAALIAAFILLNGLFSLLGALFRLDFTKVNILPWIKPLTICLIISFGLGLVVHQFDDCQKAELYGEDIDFCFYKKPVKTSDNSL